MESKKLEDTNISNRVNYDLNIILNDLILDVREFRSNDETLDPDISRLLAVLNLWRYVI